MCTEEIAVFRAFARKVDQGNHGFVVIDTAPTGHTLLLLDAANAYHRDVERNLSYIPDSVRRLLPQLRDPDFTVYNGGKHGFQAPDQEFHSAAAGSFARNSLAVVTSGRSGSAFFQSVRNC